MKFSDAFFKRIEDKTNVNKDTIVSLANKLQKGNMKDESTLRDIVKQLSALTGKNVSKEKEDKIIMAIKNDDVPKDIDKLV